MKTLPERIDFLIKEKKSSRTKLAALFGVSQPTFNGYFHSPRGKALAALTGRICELWPDVSRKWLETGEGEPYQAEQHSAEEYAALRAELDAVQAMLDAQQAENERLRSELDEERRLNRTLTAKLLLGDSTEDSATSSAKTAGGQK